jgi:hypothetical protein
MRIFFEVSKDGGRSFEHFTCYGWSICIADDYGDVYRLSIDHEYSGGLTFVRVGSLIDELTIAGVANDEFKVVRDIEMDLRKIFGFND